MTDSVVIFNPADFHTMTADQQKALLCTALELSESEATQAITRYQRWRKEDSGSEDSTLRAGVTTAPRVAYLEKHPDACFFPTRLGDEAILKQIQLERAFEG